jgi:hypothetical protein
MATPEEQKSSLLSSRLKQTRSWSNVAPSDKQQRLTQARKEARKSSHVIEPKILGKKLFSLKIPKRTQFEMLRKQMGVDDPNIQHELMLDAQARAAGAKDVFDVADLEAKRRAGILANRLLGKFAPPPNLPPPASQNLADESTQQRTSTQPKGAQPPQTGIDSSSQNEQTLNALKSAMAKQSIAQQKQALKQATEEKVNEKTREEFKKTAKAAVRRGAIFVVDLIAAALDLGSSGIAFLIDIFIYLFTLGWLDLEMVYGRWMRKGKDRFIAPISWAPIPMPLDKDAVILQVALVTANIALCVAMLFLFFGGICIVHDIGLAASMTKDALLAASAASGGGTGFCMSGIMSSMTGF